MPSHINIPTYIYRRIQIYLWFCTDTHICTREHIISGLLTHKDTHRCAYMHRCPKYVYKSRAVPSVDQEPMAVFKLLLVHNV